ncbi:MAG: hypothetical protein L6R42_008548 [Xanthoria sp. 1 TBL-2021]|nr:MAG: hypothetical protein L6R42_008548 [Xanthoria sp. 1 TBL-2021]
MSHNICYAPWTDGGLYYLSPCTDPTYSAEVCPQYCMNRTNKTQNHITYDYRARLWRCCSNTPSGVSDCDNPTSEFFSAPAPVNLTTIYSSPTPTDERKIISSTNTPSSLLSSASTDSGNTLSTSSTTPTTSTTSLLPTPSSTPTNPNPNGPAPQITNNKNDNDTNKSNNLAPGDKIALVVGIPGTLATMAAAYYAYLTFKHKRRSGKKQTIISNIKSLPTMAGRGGGRGP